MAQKINPATFDRLLTERGLTLREFSELAGLSTDTLWRIRNSRPVSVHTFRKVATVLENIAPRPLISELLAS